MNKNKFLNCIHVLKYLKAELQPKYTAEIHRRDLPKDLYFCSPGFVIYTALPLGTALSGRAGNPDFFLLQFGFTCRSFPFPRPVTWQWKAKDLISYRHTSCIVDDRLFVLLIPPPVCAQLYRKADTRSHSGTYTACSTELHYFIIYHICLPFSFKIVLKS